MQISLWFLKKKKCVFKSCRKHKVIFSKGKLWIFYKEECFRVAGVSVRKHGGNQWMQLLEFDETECLLTLEADSRLFIYNKSAQETIAAS